MKIIILFLSLIFSTSLFAKDSIPTKRDTVTVIKQISYLNTESEKELSVIKEKIDRLINAEKPWTEVWMPYIIAIIVMYGGIYAATKQSKASSISSFRVKWIEDLRIAYSEYYSTSQKVGYKIKINKLNNPIEDEDMVKLRFIEARIKLMLHHNKKDQEHIDFWSKFLQFIELNHNYYSSGAILTELEKQIDDLRLEMEDILLVIFKKEWEKAKKLS